MLPDPIRRSVAETVTETVTDTVTDGWGAFTAWVEAFYRTWQVPIDILLIILVSVLVRAVLHFVVRRMVDRVVRGVKRRQGVEDTQALVNSPIAAMRVVQRTRTLGSVLNNVVTALVVIVALILIVTTIDPNATGAFALITAALGAGLGFGAQNIVKDVLNGLFMVAEDQLGIGDVVDLGEASGVVEVVGIRVTQVRSVDGTLWYVRNGEILRVGNQSQGWARVVIDLPIPYHADIDRVQQLILDTAAALARDPKWSAKILEQPELWGIESISAEALVTRLVMKTRTGEQWGVARELRRRLKVALDSADVQLPALNRVVLDRLDQAAPNRAEPPEAPQPKRGDARAERVTKTAAERAKTGRSK